MDWNKHTDFGKPEATVLIVIALVFLLVWAFH